MVNLLMCSWLRRFRAAVPTRDYFPPGRDEGACGRGAEQITLEFFRHRLAGAQIERHAEDEGPFQEAEDDAADPVDTPQQHYFEDNGEQMSDQEENEAQQEEDKHEGQSHRNVVRQVNERPQGLGKGGSVFEGSPPPHNEAEKGTNLPHEASQETFCHKDQQNGPDKYVNKVHSLLPVMAGSLSANRLFTKKLQSKVGGNHVNCPHFYLLL